MDTILLTPEGNLLNYSHPEIVINIVVGLVIGIMLSVVYRFTHSGLPIHSRLRKPLCL